MTTLLAALGLGLAAGVNPGPLTALVVARTLAAGFAAGALVALAPLLSDTPIILSTLFLVDGLPDGAVALLSLVGGVFLIALGLREARAALAPDDASEDPAPRRPAAAELFRASLVNVLNPNAWIFWLTVGTPLVLETASTSTTLAVAFVGVFWAMLVGVKVALAGGIALAGHRMSDRWRVRLGLGSAVLVSGLGVWLAVRGVLSL